MFATSTSKLKAAGKSRNQFIYCQINFSSRFAPLCKARLTIQCPASKQSRSASVLRNNQSRTRPTRARSSAQKCCVITCHLSELLSSVASSVSLSIARRKQSASQHFFARFVFAVLFLGRLQDCALETCSQLQSAQLDLVALAQAPEERLSVRLLDATAALLAATSWPTFVAGFKIKSRPNLIELNSSVAQTRQARSGCRQTRINI